LDRSVPKSKPPRLGSHPEECGQVLLDQLDRKKRAMTSYQDAQKTRKRAPAAAVLVRVENNK
jgi:hypothetical protein